MWSTTKKNNERLSEILADENRKILSEKVKLGRFSMKSKFFFGNRGKSETGGKCIIASEGMDAPAEEQL